MPTQDTNQPQTPSPFEIVTPGKSKKGSKGLIIALVVTLFLALGIFAGVMLVRQRQQISEKAAGAKCTESCTGKTLYNCTPPEADGTSEDSICNQKGRIANCGGKKYCCPSAGGIWTTNMTACASPSPTGTATATASATPSSTASSTASATATATSTSTSTSRATATAAATRAPIPDTGSGWPTYVGVGVGVFVIIGSLLLAL